MADDIEHGTDDNFEELVAKSDIPVLVDFWAPWCSPCRAIGPVLEEIAKEYKGRAKIVKINVDEQKQVAGEMGVRSIPMLALFKDGKVVETMIGARPKQEFVNAIDKSLVD